MQLLQFANTSLLVSPPFEIRPNSNENGGVLRSWLELWKTDCVPEQRIGTDLPYLPVLPIANEGALTFPSTMLVVRYPEPPVQP